MLVVYIGGAGFNEHEMLVTTLEKDSLLRKRYFEEGGRDYDDYDRYICPDIVEINPKVHFFSDGCEPD